VVFAVAVAVGLCGTVTNDKMTFSEIKRAMSESEFSYVVVVISFA